MRQRNEEATREKILQAAIEVFAEEDFFKASVDEISKKAGVSKGIIFWHFKTKDQLILEVAKKSIPLDIVEDCIANGGEILECIGTKYLEKYDNPTMRKLFLHTLSAMNLYKELSENIRELCDSVVRKISLKIFNSEDAENLIRIRSFFGGLLCYIINPPNIDKKIYVYTLIKNVKTK
ncbi:TetR/AcrR family transcriptional regulator [Sulfolobus sp. S-194]|uniref:TetR/AcrR family transcriptional regulator n=1 Tax=Sulfolobus sp. S-194 TaxID=2512240 RepID=UPI0014373853|nr:TetR/AcrR family transcriptional regulator [Sulfolobus sp. S-194]QIW23650.1 TetR/AcrR family transcriptional regulator [Sulfolobus sp. S-194]